MNRVDTNVKLFCAVMVSMASASGMSGCWVVAAGAGAETAYVATQDDRTAGETLEDQRIVTTIKTKMIGDPLVDGLDINVDSMKGFVSLKGFAKSGRSAERAVEIARSVSGVKSVQSKLIVD